MKGIGMTPVIFAVECRDNGFTFVGSSTDPRRRWRFHRRQMNKGVSVVPAMVADWRKHGPASFSLRVLETLPQDTRVPEMRKAELRWRAHFARLGRLYNVPVCAMCGRPQDLPPEAPNDTQHDGVASGD